jgi:N-carbamoylputrescine amidase
MSVDTTKADAGSTRPRTLRVAAIQVISQTGLGAQNLARAEKLVAEAKARGAQLVVCPEFLTPGYAWDRALWNAAEPRGGMTERWLYDLARRHAIYLGAGYLEIDGDDFFNTFAFAAPDGSILGRVRKQSLPAFEGWVFRSSELPKTFESPLGRIAVGICNDNHTSHFFDRMRDEQPDLLLMPHSAPCVRVGVDMMRDAIAEIGPYYARQFGIPTVLANKAAAESVTPVPGLLPVPFRLPLRLKLQFPGMSTISDSTGDVLAQMPDDEGVIVSTISLDAARKRRPERPGNFYWSRPPRDIPNVLGAAFLGLEALAKLNYEHARVERTKAARAILSPSIL